MDNLAKTIQDSIDLLPSNDITDKANTKILTAHNDNFTNDTEFLTDLYNKIKNYETNEDSCVNNYQTEFNALQQQQ